MDRCRPYGIIHIIFGDTRDNPPEAFEPPQFPPPPTPPPRPVYHVYYSNSTDGGGTFLANGRVTDTPSVVAAGPFFGPPFIGDYFNVAVSRESVQVVWADLRLRSDIFTARMPSKPIPESFPAFLKPARGVVGTPVQLTGTASPNTTIQVYYDETALGTAKADAEGSFSFDFIVPESIAAPNRVTAVDGTTGKLATTLFTIEPSLKILPSVALPGASISAIGTGYLPQSAVFILFNKTLIAFAVTDVIGSFTFSFTRTPFSEEGDWEIRAQDISSPLEAKAILRIPISTNNILLQVNGTSATIVGRLQSVEGNVATVIIPGLGEVKATLQRQVSAVEATQSLSSNILILNVATLVGAWAAVVLVILLTRTRKS